VRGARTDDLVRRPMAMGPASTGPTRYVYPSSYVAGADASMKTVTAEASIFEVKGEKLVWSARTRTTDALSTTGADFAPQYIEVILDAMKKDKLL
jgi:hypothetical protein